MDRRRFCLGIALWARQASALGDRGTEATDGSQAGPPGQEISLEYFGTHFHRLMPTAGESATQWVDGMVGSIRLWDSGTRWGDLAPRAGQWNFTRLDAYVEAAQRHGASALYTLGSTPRWVSKRPDEPGPYGPGCAAEPVNLWHWEEYVARVATRYRGRIHAFELWNEPTFSDLEADRRSPGFFTGGVADMVAMAAAARRVLDRIDPAAVLTTPGFVNGPHRLDLFLASGGAGSVQAVAYHLYARDTRQFVDQVRAVRDVCRQRGLEALPLWNTECGVEDQPVQRPEEVRAGGSMSEFAEGCLTAQYLVLGAALSIQRFYYYAWDSDRSGMIDRNGRRRSRFFAMRQVQYWLLGARLGRPVSHGPSATLVHGASGAERFIVAWSEVAQAEDLPLPAGWSIASCDPLFERPGSPTAWSGGCRVRLSSEPVRVNLAVA